MNPHLRARVPALLVLTAPPAMRLRRCPRGRSGRQTRSGASQHARSPFDRGLPSRAQRRRDRRWDPAGPRSLASMALSMADTEQLSAIWVPPWVRSKKGRTRKKSCTVQIEASGPSPSGSSPGSSPLQDTPITSPLPSFPLFSPVPPHLHPVCECCRRGGTRKRSSPCFTIIIAITITLFGLTEKTIDSVSSFCMPSLCIA